MTLTRISNRLPLAMLALALAVTFVLSRDARAQGGLFDGMMGAGQGPHDWSGLYLGGQAGYAWGDASFVFPAVLTLHDNDVEGFLGGFHVGYNIQAADAVFGVVADVNFGNVNGSHTIFGVTTLDTEVEVSGSIRGRFGILLTERVLLYGTAGLAIAGVDHTITSGATDNYSGTMYGFTAGAGVEYAFNDMLSMFVEGRWTSYGDETFAGSVFTPHAYSLDYAQVQGGFSIHFNNWLGGGY